MALCLGTAALDAHRPPLEAQQIAVERRSYHAARLVQRLRTAMTRGLKMTFRMTLMVCAALTVSACDHPMFHQDRPGGSDYRGYQPSYAAPHQEMPTSGAPAPSESYDRT